MKKVLMVLVLSALVMQSQAQNFDKSHARFHWGDNMEWKSPDMDDSQWQIINTDVNWSAADMNREKTYAWYRVHFTVDKSILNVYGRKNELRLTLPYIDDADVTYVNGVRVGGTGSLPDSPEGYTSGWSKPRAYSVPVKCLNFDGDNVIAIRMWNEGDEGGLFSGRGEFDVKDFNLDVPTRFDDVKLLSETATVKGEKVVKVTLQNNYAGKQKGVLKVLSVNPEDGTEIANITRNITVGAKKSAYVTIPAAQGYQRVKAIYTDPVLNKTCEISFVPKYILTPKAPETPRFNMAGVLGVRPGSPVIYRLPVSGLRPMTFSIVGEMPDGLHLDAVKGVISGSLQKNGDYNVRISATNEKGTSEATLTIRVGNTIALTPPMGWNSWNCWGLSVTQDKVISSAQALIDKGLADYGYAYINVDDGWEAEERNANGTIAVNDKFPSMKALGDWLHGEGLKFGIYSSPGDRTCGGFLGSIDHELQDAESYNSWGIDYLKYDWCGYYSKHATEPDNTTVASYVRPYLLMERYLRQQPRDIFYSLCQYGMADVWKWGPAVDANSWRTTGDITDTWASLYNIGFQQQTELYPYAAPGHWNDPDMLIVGKVGWSANLRDSRLTPDEQYTHITLWSLLASNMLIGCDIAQMDDFTIALLCNNEVNAINQDTLGHQAKKVIDENGIQVWMRPLSDGHYAVGVFNVSDEDATVDFAQYLNRINLKGTTIRDLWRQKNLTTTQLFIPTHGCRLIKVM